MKRLSDRQAALDEIKAFVRAKAAPDTIDMAALSLSGLSDDALEAGIAELAQTMAGHLATLGRGTHVQRGLSFAFAEVVRARVAALEATGRGRA